MTEPTPEPTALSSILAPRQRAIVYVLSVMLAAAYAVVEANVDLHWGVMAGYAAWNAGVGVLAVSNTAAAVTEVEP